jgi:transposase
MRFVITKTADQLDLQSLHRIRERLVSQRTGGINQIRAFLLERGIAVRQGQHFLRTVVKLRADAQRLELPFACPCFSLAWARKNAARAAEIGIAGLFIVGITVLVIDHDRFAACLAGMTMFRCSGRLD